MTNTYRETEWRDNGQKSSDEIKADIERTRNNMSAKLDTIQDRLSPDNLKQQAQTMVQDVVKESTDAITDYVSTTMPQITNTVVDLVRRNPVPAALIGVGLGWLLVRSMSGDDHNRKYARTYRPQYRPQQQVDDAYRTATYPSDATYYTGDYARDGGQRKPRPNSAEMEYNNNNGRRDLDKIRQQVQGENLGNGGNPQGIVDKVREAVSDVGEQISSAAQLVAERTGDLADQATNATGSVRHQATEWGGQAQHVGHQVQQSIEDSPLAFGAVALAVGVVIGLALPATRRENEWLGETRDRLVENAQEVVGDVAQRVQHVASEVAPKVEEAAKKVTEEVKQSTKAAASDVAGSVKSATSEMRRELEQKVQNESQPVIEANKPSSFAAS